MYGINLLQVSKVLGFAVVRDTFFKKYGVIPSIFHEIQKYAAQQNIEMVRVMMRTLAQQHEQAYNDIVKILQDHFTEEELQDILP